jgi:fibronectin type 3 domain-containing protein
MKKIYIAIIALMISSFSFGQIESDTLLLFTKLSNQGVHLKIMPQKAQTWLLGAENGYQIYRKEVGVNKDFVLLNKEPLKPFSGSDYDVFENGKDVKELQQKAIFDNIARNKQKMNMAERVQFVNNLQNEYGFYILVSTRIPSLAKSSGTVFLDKTAKKGKLYIYKVSIAGDNQPSRRTEKIVNHMTDDLGVAELEPTEMDHQIRLNWTHVKENNPILCYHIEKSEDGVNFTRITEAPVYPTNMGNDDEASFSKEVFYIDSLEANYKTYYYRMVGIDAWATEHQSPIIIKVIGRDRTPPPAVVSAKYNVDTLSKSITYHWNYDAPTDFAGYKFYLSNKLKGEYQLQDEAQASTTNSSFTIKNAGEFDVFYLRVETWDTAGNKSISLPFFAYVADIYPPSSPTGANAHIDTNGIMTLSWDANTEADVVGYKILASQSAKRRMIAITPKILSDTFFVDTLNIKVLNKYKYFRIMAVDHNFNMSAPGKLIKVTLPDVVAPSSGKITSVDAQASEVIINWIQSASNDVASQRILRRKMGSDQWQEVKSVGFNTTSYTDKPFAGAWEYSIMAVDSSGNKGIKSFTYAIEIKAKAEHITIDNFKAKKSKKGVELSWNSSGQQAKFFIIYRQDKKGSLKAIASVADTKYIDSQVQKGNSYKYYIVPQDDKGVKYSMSKVEKVGF